MTALTTRTQEPRPSLRHLAGVATLASLLGCAPGLDRSIPDPGDRAATYLNALVAKDREVGLQYLVVDATDIIFEHVVGRRDIVNGDPVTPETTFLSASSSKVVTAAAVLLLVQRGSLRLDDPLSQYLPDLPYGDGVRLRNLLNQSSGLPNPMPLDWLHTRSEHESYDEAATLRGVIADHPDLDFEPGERYAYSNLSYWLLGALIEKTTGTSYCDYLRRELFSPLGIGRDELDCEVQDWSHHARGHQNRHSLLGMLMPLMTSNRIWDDGSGKWRRLQHLHMNGPAYGGLVGNYRGYAKLLQDLLGRHSRLFNDAMRAEFFSPQHDRRGRLMPTTLGWHRSEVGGTVAYSKPGGGPGFSANVRLYPERALATVFLSNQMRASESEIQDFSDALDQPFVEARGGLPK